MKNTQQMPVAAAVAWYRREQWTLMLSLIPDAEVFPHTYDEWLATASDTVAKLSLQGISVRKVEVELNALLEWAAEQGRAPDGAARAAFARHLADEADKVEAG